MKPYSLDALVEHLGIDLHVGKFRNEAMKTVELEIRRASPSDANEIAAAHRHSIRSIGALYYPATIVNDWGARVEGDLYVNATVDALRSAVSRKGPEVPQYLS